MTAGRLLFITDQPPWPAATNGFTMRYHAILGALAARQDVDLLVLPGDRGDQVDGDETLRPRLRAVRRIAPVRLPATLRRVRRALFWAQYLSPASDPAICHHYERPELERAVRASVGDVRYEGVVLASWKYAVLTRALRELVPCDRLVVDLIDSPALLVQRDSFGGINGTFRRLETVRLRRLEREIARRADRLLYVSRVDAHFANAAADNVRVVPICVSEGEAGGDERNAEHWSIGFLGHMSYWPNVRAARWLAERVLGRVRARHPAASLVVIGRDPAEAVRRLATLDGVTVTGTVGSIWGHLRAVDVCAFPMFAGAGMQYKVLEAMLAGRPVVTTPIGNEGIDAKPGSEILVVNDEDGFVREIDRLLAEPADARRIGENGRNFVRSRFSQDAVLKSYESVLRP